MRKLDQIVIVGGGGFGREVYGWLASDPNCGVAFRIKGFLDDHRAHGQLSPSDPLAQYPVPVLDTIDQYTPDADDVFVVAIGDPKAKEQVVGRLLKKNAKFLTYVHPSAIISTQVKLGRGCFVCPSVVISCDVEIGDFVMLNIAATVGHDARIGEYSTLSSHADVTGNCVLGKGVFMGSHAALIPKTTVGDFAVISAGSVGIRKVKAHTTVLGVPGKRFEIQMK